jgi:uncharacterized protein
VEPTNLTEAQRLQLVNQYKILARLDPKNEEQYLRLCKILEQGITVYYENVFEGIYPEIGLQKCYFVKEVADMFLALQSSFKKLQDKGGLNHRDVLFFGFDVGDEDEWRYMEFLKRSACKWEEERIWQWIVRMLETGPESNLTVRREHYIKMLERWNAIKPKYEDDKEWKLTKEEIVAIIADDNVPE